MKKKGNRLTDMEFDEVSLVTRPANQMSKVVLFKSDESPTEEQVNPEDQVEEVVEAEVAEVEVAEVEVAEESVEKGYGMDMKMKKKKEMPAFIKEKMMEARKGMKKAAKKTAKKVMVKKMGKKK